MNQAAIVALCVAGALVLLLYTSGALDEPLSDVGLNTQDCAQTLFGQKRCGDELYEWCHEHYDERLNADACDGILRDRGDDPAVLEAARDAREENYYECIERSAVADVDECDPP